MSETAARSNDPRELPVAELVPLRRVDDDPVGDVDELLPLRRRRTGARRASGGRRAGRRRERQHDRRRRERAVAAQVQLDHLAADGAVADREAAHGDARRRSGSCLVGARHEDHRARGMPLGQPLERSLGRVEPLAAAPRRRASSRSSAGAGCAPRRPRRRGAARAPTRSRRASRRGRQFSLLDQWRRHERPSRCSSSSADGGPHVPAGVVRERRPVALPGRR